MADNLSPLVNLDLINQIYKTINAQITERVYDPQYYTSATLGSESHKYVNAYISGNVSTGTLNNLTLTEKSAGFTISGGASKTLTVEEAATIKKSLAVEAATTIKGSLAVEASTSIKGSLTVSAATNIVKSLTVGDASTGAVTIRSGGANSTTIIGPDKGTASLINGVYKDSAITENSTTPTENKLLKIKKVDANTFLAGPETGSNAVPTYRVIKAADLPEASKTANGIVTTGKQTFAGIKTFEETISGSIDGNAKTATTADKTAKSISVVDGAAAPVTAIDSWNGSSDKTLTIKGTSPITTAATTDTITVTHDKKGPSTSADTSKGDTSNQTPGFGGTFKVTSATVDKYGHTTAFADHTVTIPSTAASAKTSGLVTTGNQTFAGTKTFEETIDGNAATADKVKTEKANTDASYYVSFVGNNNDSASAETVYTCSSLIYSPGTDTLSATTFNGTANKVAHGLSINDGVNTTLAIDSWDGSSDETLTIKGESSIATKAAAGTITVTHDKQGPDATKAISKGDASDQTPGFGGTFKVTSATVNAYGHTTAFADHTVTIPSATASAKANGLMSSTHWSKLEGIASGAEVNQNAFSNITVGDTTIQADSKTDTLTLEAGSNVTLTPDSKTSKVTIKATDTTYTVDSGDSNGQIKVTPSSGDAYNVSVKGLGSNAYSSTSYLPLAGGTITGQISKKNNSTSWRTGRDVAPFKTIAADSPGDSQYVPVLSAKSYQGSWDLGPYTGNILHLSYITDSNYSSGNNAQTADFTFQTDGTFSANKVYGAVWNDLSDSIPVDDDCELECGYCYCFDGEKYAKASRYLDDGIIGIHSDTYGFKMGSEEGKKKMDVAVSGFVLAHVDKEYKPGTPLTCTKNGHLTKIKFKDKLRYPEKIIATYWKNEPADEWGSDDRKVKVNGRKWVKIK